MECINCKTNLATKLTTVSDDDGNPFTFCNLCPRPKPKEINFPAIITGKRGRGRPKGVVDKLKKYELTPEEIKRTQALKPKTVKIDTKQSRMLADRTLIKEGKRTIVYFGGDSPNRNKLALEKVKKQLKTDNVDIKFDDGFKIIADAVV